MSRVFVYIDTRQEYYARYVERTRTDRLMREPGYTMTPQWVELLRVAPREFDEPTEPEVA